MSKVLFATALVVIMLIPAGTVAAASDKSVDHAGQSILTDILDIWHRLTGKDDHDEATKPGDVIDFDNWYLTLPTGSKGNPDTVRQPQLADLDSPYMRLNDAGDGVVFSANAGGVSTKNSGYPRSELREMDGDKPASWDGSKGSHVMEVRQAVTKVPPKKSDVVVDQIHATTDDLMQVELTGGKLIVKYADGKKKVTLEPKYQLGTIFTIKIESAKGHVKVWYNGQQKADLPISSKTSYFKTGNYLQTNTSKGEDAAASAEVVVYSVKIQHANQ